MGKQKSKEKERIFFQKLLAIMHVADANLWDCDVNLLSVCVCVCVCLLYGKGTVTLLLKYHSAVADCVFA